MRGETVISRNFTECYILEKYEISKTFCVGVFLLDTPKNKCYPSSKFLEIKTQFKYKDLNASVKYLGFTWSLLVKGP